MSAHQVCLLHFISFHLIRYGLYELLEETLFDGALDLGYHLSCVNFQVLVWAFAEPLLHCQLPGALMALLGSDRPVQSMTFERTVELSHLLGVVQLVDPLASTVQFSYKLSTHFYIIIIFATSNYL